jgi:energy-converting hydrogenase Eha subunit C
MQIQDTKTGNVALYIQAISSIMQGMYLCVAELSHTVNGLSTIILHMGDNTGT